MALYRRPSILRAVLVALSLGLASPAWSASGIILDRIVAAVNGQIVTLAELGDAAGVAALQDKQTPSPREILDTLIDQKLLYREALRYRLGTVLPEDVEAEVDRMKAAWPTEAAFLTYLAEEGLSLEAVEKMLERQVRIRRFLDRRIFVHVGTSEVRRFYEAHRREFNEQPLHTVQEEIRRYLEERLRNVRIEALLRDLRRNADIRINQEALSSLD